MKKIIFMTFLIFTFAGYLCGNLNRQIIPERGPAFVPKIMAKDSALPALNDKRLAQAMQQLMKTPQKSPDSSPMELIKDMQADMPSEEILAQMQRPEMREKLQQQLGRRQEMNLRLRLKLFHLCEKLAIDEGSIVMLAHDDLRLALQEDRTVEALAYFRYILQNSQDNDLIRESGQELLTSDIDKTLRETALTYVKAFRPNLSGELTVLANLSEP